MQLLESFIEECLGFDLTRTNSWALVRFRKIKPSRSARAISNRCERAVGNLFIEADNTAFHTDTIAENLPGL